MCFPTFCHLSFTSEKYESIGQRGLDLRFLCAPNAYYEIIGLALRVNVWK